MSNNACRYLSNKYHIASEFGRLKYRPCCYFRNAVYFDDPAFTTKVERIQNQELCNDCGYYGSTDVPNVNPIKRSYQQIQESTPTGVPVILELTLDSDCNAACLSCNPGLSSTWRAQEFKFNIKNRLDYPDSPDVTSVVQQVFDRINFSQVTRIEILGGEPFRSVATELVLDHARACANSRNIDVMFSTNGTVRPSDRVLELIKSFKSVKFIVSIDGTDKQFEYLRYPLSWDSLINNLQFLKNNRSISGIELCYTIGVMNVLNYPDFDTWATEFFKDCPSYVGTFLNMCYGSIGLDKITPALKIAALNKNKQSVAATKMISSVIPASQCNELLQFINHWDSLRKTSWTNTFPNLINFLEQTNGI